MYYYNQENNRKNNLPIKKNPEKNKKLNFNLLKNNACSSLNDVEYFLNNFNNFIKYIKLYKLLKK